MKIPRNNTMILKSPEKLLLPLKKKIPEFKKVAKKVIKMIKKQKEEDDDFEIIIPEKGI